MLNPKPFSADHRGGGPIGHAKALNKLEEMWNFAEGRSGITITMSANGKGPVFDYVPNGQQTGDSYPFRVYVEPNSGGTSYICIQSGLHVWWNQNTRNTDLTTIAKTPSDAWQAIGSAYTIYIKRVRNTATDAATVTPVATTDSVATVLGACDNEEKRWILATVSASGIVTQRYLAGDIYEHRVS